MVGATVAARLPGLFSQWLLRYLSLLLSPCSFQFACLLFVSLYEGKNLDEYDFSDSFIDDAAEEDDEEESSEEDDDEQQDLGEDIGESSNEEADASSTKKRITKGKKVKCVSRPDLIYSF